MHSNLEAEVRTSTQRARRHHQLHHAAHPCQWSPVALGRVFATSTQRARRHHQLLTHASGSQWRLGVRSQPAFTGLVAVGLCGAQLQTLLKALRKTRLRPPTADCRLQKARSRSGSCSQLPSRTAARSLALCHRPRTRVKGHILPPRLPCPLPRPLGGTSAKVLSPNC